MKQVIFIIPFAFILSGCVKNNPDPSWLEVSAWTLLGNPELINIEGELSHNFSDAWVYVNDKNIGVFELPFKIPVLESGACNIKLFPAIRNNGISAKKKIYPFVDKFELNAVLVKNEVLQIKPVTKYNSATKFWIEDFEDANTEIISDPNSATTMTVGTSSNIMKWNRYGIVALNSTDSTWVASTSENLKLPKGEEVYLELDYYNTNSLVTGLISISSNSKQNNSHVILNPQEPSDVRWKKIYIELGKIVSSSGSANAFNLSFLSELDQGDSEGIVVLDNIKVVHF